MKQLHVHCLPDLVDAQELAGRTVVVIDVLRATTTIVQALASGAELIKPYASVDDARAAAASMNPAPLLCGERYGHKIDDFDLGNSPSEYTADVVKDRHLVMTTTNGTRAIEYCRAASNVLLAAFTNLGAVCDQLRGVTDCHLVCAGTDGEVTKEDALLAGAIIAGLDEPQLENSGAKLASTAWQRTDPAQLAHAFEETTGGQNLIMIGMQDDLGLAAAIDQHSLVPFFDASAGTIQARQPGDGTF